jgi:nucleotide-binding universal stress UspA family protein
MGNKILAVFDGTRYSEGASKYALEIAKATNSMLIGIFIQDMRYINFTYAYAWDQPFVDFTAIEESQKEEKEKIDLNIKLFHQVCNDKGVKHKVHLDKGVPLQDVLRESAFADMMIIDSHTSFFSLGDSAPNPFLKDVLVDSHCPVLIVPHQYNYFDNATLCYDGSPSSVYAVKMFSYLFPGADSIKTTVVSVTEKTGNHIKDGTNFKDLLHTRFSNLEFEVLQGNVGDELLSYLKNKDGNFIVVMGAYGRNAFSRLLHQSISNRVIKELNVPVFIAHQ